MFLLLLFLCIRSCVVDATLREEAFKIGRKYVYNYETQLFTGIDGSAQYSGIKVKALATLQFTGDTTAVLQLENIRLLRVNDEIYGADPTKEMLADQLFLAFNGKDMDDIRNYLILPVQFSYAKGHIGDFQTDEKEPLWSVNIKRGIISLFEMNIDSKRSLQEDHSFELFNTPIQQEFGFIKTVEPTPAGECETFYKIQPEPPRGTENEFFVTKIRDYKNCLDRPLFTRSMTSSTNCSECKKPQPIESISRTEYSLIGDTNMFVIVSAAASEQHDVTPFSEKGGRITTYIRQSLSLKQVDTSSPNKIALPRLYDQPSGLKMDIPQSADNPSNPFFPDTLREKVETEKRQDDNCVVRQVEEIINALLWKDKQPNHSAPELILQMINVLRKASNSAIKIIIHNYEATAKARKLFFEILPVVGTRDSTMEVIEALTRGIIPTEIIPRCLYTIAMSAKPEPILIKQIMTLLETDKIPINKDITQAAWLSIGIIGQNLYRWNQSTVERTKSKIASIQNLLFNAGHRYIRRELDRMLQMEQDLLQQTGDIYSIMKQEILKNLVDILSHANPDLQILGLKALGNTGFEEVIPHVIPFCDKKKPRSTRIQALQTLSMVGWKSPVEIVKYILPIYLDIREPSDVRIYAAQSIFSSNPKQTVLNTLAHSLQREENEQVASFVYSYMEQLSKTNHQCRLSISRRFMTALHISKQFNPSIRSSQFRQFSTVSESFQMGAYLDMLMVMNTQSLLPNGVSLKLLSYIFGYNTDILEIGFYGRQSPSRSLREVLRNLWNSFSNGKPMFSEDSQNIKMTLKNVYMKIFGHEVGYAIVENGGIDKFIKGLYSRSTRNGIDFDRNVLHKDVYALSIADHYLPTTVGIPINIKLDAAAKMDLHLKANGTIPLAATVNISKVSLDVKPKLSFTLKGSVRILAPFIDAGVDISGGLLVDTPITISSTIQMPKRKVSTVFAIQNEPVVRMHMTPSTFISVSMCCNPSFYRKDISVVNGADTVPISIRRADIVHGLAMEMEGQYMVRKDLPYVPLRPLCGKTEIAVTIKSMSGKIWPVRTDLQFSGNSVSQVTKPSTWARQTDTKTEEVERKAEFFSEALHDVKNNDFSIKDTMSSLKVPEAFIELGAIGLRLLITTGSGETRGKRQLVVLLTRDKGDGQHRLFAKFITAIPPTSSVSRPFEVSCKASVRLQGMSKTVQEVTQRKNEIAVFKELDSRSVLQDIEQFVSFLSSHYIRQFANLTSFAETSVRGEQVFNELLRIPLPDEDTLLGIIKSQILAENILQHIKSAPIYETTTTNGLSSLKKLLNTCQVVIEMIQKNILVKNPTGAPVFQYVIGKQLSLHDEVSSIMERMRAVSKRRYRPSLRTKRKLESQQVTLITFLKEFMKELPTRQAFDEKHIMPALRGYEAKLFGIAHEIEREQSNYVINVIENKHTVDVRSFEVLLKQMASLQDKVLSILESGLVPDEQLVFKISSIIINQGEIITPFLSGLSQEKKTSVIEKEHFLNLASQLLFRGQIMVKTLPIVSDLNRERFIILPSLPKEQVALYNALLQTEQQTIFLALKSMLVLRHSTIVNVTKYHEHMKQYVMSIQQLSYMMSTAIADFTTKGVNLYQAILLKITKITTWYEKTYELFKVSVLNSTPSSSEIFTILEDNGYKMLLRKVLNEVVTHLKPLLSKAKADYLLRTTRDPCSLPLDHLLIQFWQTGMKDRLNSLVSRGFYATIPDLVKECRLVNKIISFSHKGVTTDIKMHSSESIRTVIQEQVNIINHLINAISQIDALPRTKLYNYIDQLLVEKNHLGAAAYNDTRVSMQLCENTSMPGDLPVNDRKLDIQARLEFGRENSVKENIFMKVLARKSIQQLIWEHDQSSVFNRDPAILNFIAGDSEDPSFGNQKKSLENRINQMRSVEVIVNYEQMKSQVVQKWISKLHGLMISSFYPNLLESVEEVPAPRYMYGRVDIGPNNEQTDITFDTEGVSSLFRNIKIPIILQQLLSYQLDYKPAQALSASSLEGYCTLLNKTLTRNIVLQGLKTICFSRDVVSYCPENCLPLESITKSINFQCALISNPKIQRLLKKKISVPIDIPELSVTELTQEVKFPTACHSL